MCILVADDDPVYQVLLKDMLARLDCEAIIVGDGQAAWDVLKGENPPRLAIIDWMMPHIDGFELCRMVRQDDAVKDLYVLLLTNSRKKSDIVTAVVAGADDYLIKPFDPMDLKIRLRAAERILGLQDEIAGLRKQLHNAANAA